MQKPLSEYNSIVVLTGAGVSAESGLKTFRDNNGLWEGHDVSEVATPEAFEINPALVHSFYNARRNQLLEEAKPNLAHKSLSRFEAEFNGGFTLITQNVDNLHEQAGSQNVIHMHGELLQVRCINTGIVFQWTEDLTTQTHCPCCKIAGSLRPNIVWFGEIPMHMHEIEEALSHCDLFVSIGTSGNVYPAAGFVQLANAMGATTLELNLEPSLTQSAFAFAHYGPATEIVPSYFSI
ncbi:Sir2 family NAD+-dependent deacetylase [Teredinibacter sp. KSP-S5-2]|uniref:Sir2 family NAD+-dependent deacetylase n=1 Tax=Teredinibacter sp. KSP-S5-2 TaxID=3034506 RepID=UPI002934B13F|nr:Sir2 family NAD+-dependent deacetylase [Teredinibacter sp. KSP-S5-2]WNO07587.1 NAD-dependent protein deacylase [Teredinibacter sp. KSP-S5-2]